MPRRKYGRANNRPRHWLEWFEKDGIGSLEPDPDRFALLEILILAKGKVHPYAGGNNKRLGDTLTRVLRRAKLRIAGRKKANEDITDEEIRLEALEILKKHIVFSSLTIDEHHQWDDAVRVAAEMEEKCDREMEKLDEFIKTRT